MTGHPALDDSNLQAPPRTRRGRLVRRIWLVFRFAPDAVEEEVAGALDVGFGFGVSVEVHDLPLGSLFADGAVGGPLGEAGGVGVAGAREVGPIGPHLVGQLAVFGTPDGLGAGVEG